MIDLGRYRVWFVVGSQDLYGDNALATVADHTQQLVAALNAVDCLPFPSEYRPVLKTADAITATMQQANAEPDCIGVIAWMHTFSPAKMWTQDCRRCDARCCTCTRSSTATSLGPTSTWTS